ncbi:hypothetical protein F4680DRAFT_410490 [Xylaria scruposa]|nr:hypothetical protein F4680DRAFT_410490 [Xylaria scruposa]
MMAVQSYQPSKVSRSTHSDPTETINPSGEIRPASARSFALPDLPRKVLDPDGDLTLTVGETKCVDNPPSNPPSDEHQTAVIYTVCSKALSRVSPVWKALLYGGFSESKPSSASTASDWVVKLPDDNPRAMETILNIIHSRFESLPRTTDIISLEDLYQLTVLTDKYDLTAILRPWRSIWMSAAEEKCKSLRFDNCSVTSDLEQLSWVTWEMGHSSLFQRVSLQLALHCAIDDNGDLQNNTGNEIIPLFSSTLEPPGHHDQLKAIRLKNVEKALAVYGDSITNLLKRKDDSKRVMTCSQIALRHVCEPAMLGEMISSLSCSGYWPLPAAGDIRKSVRRLVQDLSCILITSPLHPGCLGVHDRPRKLNGCLELPLFHPWPPSITARMAKQAVKLGIQ